MTDRDHSDAVTESVPGLSPVHTNLDMALDSYFNDFRDGTEWVDSPTNADQETTLTDVPTDVTVTSILDIGLYDLRTDSDQIIILIDGPTDLTTVSRTDIGLLDPWTVPGRDISFTDVPTDATSTSIPEPGLFDLRMGQYQDATTSRPDPVPLDSHLDLDQDVTSVDFFILLSSVPFSPGWAFDQTVQTPRSHSEPAGQTSAPIPGQDPELATQMTLSTTGSVFGPAVPPNDLTLELDSNPPRGTISWSKTRTSFLWQRDLPAPPPPPPPWWVSTHGSSRSPSSFWLKGWEVLLGALEWCLGPGVLSRFLPACCSTLGQFLLTTTKGRF